MLPYQIEALSQSTYSFLNKRGMRIRRGKPEITKE
jgi:hypothetical protein